MTAASFATTCTVRHCCSAPPWSGRLLWSSSETADQSAGHIDGALAAAERTVESITASNRIEPTR